MAYGTYGYQPIFPSTYMPQTYGRQQTPMQQPMPQQIGANYICRPVAGEEEARAVPTDFAGATTVMVDAAHGCIYTKALNPMDGTAIFQVYRIDNSPPVQDQPPQYAQAQDLEQLRQEIEEIRAAIGQKKPSGKGGIEEA